jgi:SAM-dependent methyltransferase
VIGTLTTSIKELPVVRFVRHSAIKAEARWFDWRHNVQTQADSSEDLRDWTAGFPYLPTRPNAARRVIRSLPIGDPSEYTFVDLGSGKGRMLLIASEFAFLKVVGVEMREDLHGQAKENARRYRNPAAQSSRIDCRLVDATHFDFPAGKLVVYLFNPFSPEIMGKVFQRLDASFEQDPREIVLVYVYPQFGFQLKTLRHFEMCQETPRCCIAKSHSANYTCAG